MNNIVNIAQKLSMFNDYWSPKIVGEVNNHYVKVAKLKGEFVWHKHEGEDEMFLIIKGNLIIKLRDRDIHLQPGEFFIVPQGVEHCPVAHEEVEVMLFEPKTVLNTGDVMDAKTVKDLDCI